MPIRLKDIDKWSIQSQKKMPIRWSRIDKKSVDLAQKNMPIDPQRPQKKICRSRKKYADPDPAQGRGVTPSGQ